MKSELILGVVGALITGAAIGAQTTLSSRTGSLINPVRTGLLTNFAGGFVAGLIVLFLLSRQGLQAWSIPTPARIMLFSAGLLGIGIIMGISFSLQRTGITAGLATVILGQLSISVVVDATGWGGVEPIPIDPQRIAGLIVMALAVYLLLPRG